MWRRTRRCGLSAVSCQQRVDGIGQGCEVEVGGVAGGFGAWFAMFGVAFDEDGGHAEAAAKFYIGPRVAKDGAGFRGYIGEVCERLMEEAGEGLAAVALGFIVGAEVEGVDARTLGVEVSLEGGVDVEDIGCSVEAEGDAALIGDDEDAEADAVEFGDGCDHAGKWLELALGGDEAAFGHLAVDDSVAVEEDGVQRAWRIAVCGVRHTAMIPTDTG